MCVLWELLPTTVGKNPAERIMSILNLALQGVGTARAPTAHEDQLHKCKNMKQIQELAKSLADVEKDILDVLEQPNPCFQACCPAKA